ncbi:TnsA-like heteromeric transposase endonuclease subunit [Streptomyces sp. NPDC002514]|uniref:TnsA-like heteromeric transposase endonuclease subunit n=1 Tax=Streptomyces sp. NPDC001270 TaxID=3364554 RepID=UPI0036B06B78
MESLVPWRTFRWYYGQKHYSGFYWSSTMRAHVIYESRLELTRLIYADFSPDVRSIYAQPFLIAAEIDKVQRRHVPDFLLLRDDSVPMVVDVKPRELLTRPKVSFSLGWAREVVESWGWEYQVWCEPPHDERANLRFLAGYRHAWLFRAELLQEIRAADLDGATLGDAFRSFPNWPKELVRASIFHLLWSQDLSTDLDGILSERNVLGKEAATVVGAGVSVMPDPIDEHEKDDREAAVSNHIDGSGGKRRSGQGAARVGVGTRFHYDGEVVTVVEMFGSSRGNEILVKDGRGRRFRLSLREVLSSGRARVIAENPGPSSEDPGETASVTLALLEDSELGTIRERAAHLNEVLYGYRSGTPELAGPGEPRPEYTPGTPKMDRYRAKAEELGVGVRTLRRWIAAFEAEREAALARDLPERSADSAGVGRADPRLVEMALEIMAEHEDDATPTRSKVIRSIGPRLEARYGKGEVPLPRRATAYRWISELEKRRPTFRLSAQRNRDVASRPAGVYGKLRPTRPGEFLLLDTNRLDVFALDPLTLKWVQPELTAAMDWYDRCVTGLRLTPASTKSVDVAATLFETYRPRPACKDWPRDAVWPDHGIPRTVLLDRDAIEGPMADAAARVTGQGSQGPGLVPETIVVDHGKPYVSEHITSVCQRLGISIQPARLRTGRDKGPLERFFRTLREGLLENLPGYKGPDIHGRGVNPEGEAFFFLNELEAIIREWVALVYHHSPHEGLVDPRIPGLEFSPASMFDHGIARAGYIEVPRDPDLGFEFLKTDWRSIQHYGVEIRGCRYNGTGLNGLRNQTSPYTSPRAKGRWPIHVDPDDITRVYFRRPDTRKWHTLDWEHAPAMKFPVSEDALELARKMARHKYRYPDDENALTQLLERWNLGLGLTRSERRVALRMAREQSAIDLPTTDSEVAMLPSVAKVMAANVETVQDEEEPEPEPYEGAHPGDDDEDDELDVLVCPSDGPDGEDDYYADALEDA